MIGPFNLSSFESKNNCCGCRACESICSVGAISIDQDAEGFLYPLVDIQVCVNCGLCEQVCPIVKVNKNQISEYAWACYSKDKDIRKNASSGGVFELLAREVIAEGGVVFGAAFDNELTLKHMYTDNLQELTKLCKSKYIQSDSDRIFVKVKEFLLENRRVLFVGTPCQVSALNNFLGKPYYTLLTVDFICHGVPSGRMFKSYIKAEEKKRGGNMASFSFRIKDGKIKHIHGYSFTIEKNGKSKIYRGMFFDNPFYFGFKKYLFLRPSCYKCKYCTPERVADLTLADFWGIEDYLPDIDFNKGISMVLVNNEKGRNAFDTLHQRVDSFQFGIDIAIKCNQCLSAPTKLPERREKLMQDYQSLSFDEFAQRHLMSKKMVIYKIYYSLPAFIRKRLMKMFKGISYV